MSLPPENGQMDRRRFLQTTVAGVGAAAMAGPVAQSAEEKAPASQPATQASDKDLIWLSRQPDMEYARLGRTNFMVSRIVAGWCKDLPLDRLLSRGVNYYDNALGYGNYEVQMKPFLRNNRGKLFLISKATDIAGHAKIDEGVIKLYRKAMQDFLGESEGDLFDLHNKAVAKQNETGKKPDLHPVGRHMAKMYLDKLDQSLKRMGVDDVDAYFMHGIEIPWHFDCLEVWEAYEKVHKAGKVKHFGFSTHNHIKEVLAAAVAANQRGPWKIDIAMPQCNSALFDTLKPELAALKKQDVGIIAMKTKGIANRPVDGREAKFKSLTQGKSYNEWERAKLWMLHLTDGLIDGVIAAMNNVDEMERTLALATVKLSAAAEKELRALVKLEMAGTCHVCGACEPACPEHITLTNMIRYHAYIHQYDEKELARSLYAKAGYDPAKLCTSCGKCVEVCPSGVQITRILAELSACMA